jgi:hypothetical protein
MDRDEISNLYRGSAIDASYQISVHLGKQFQRRRFFLNFIPLFSIFSLAAILVGSREHQTHFWKGAIQGSFHQSLVAKLNLT